MVIPGHNLGNSQVSVNRTIGPTIVLLDPLKPHFYYISTGLRGSISHRDFSMMVTSGELPTNQNYRYTVGMGKAKHKLIMKF